MLNENLDTFLADFGQTVVLGGVSGLGVLDMPDQVVDGLGISTEYTLLVRTSVYPSATRGDTITVGGVSYKVREYRKVDDGQFARITLSIV
jgi:hypothetical protein